VSVVCELRNESSLFIKSWEFIQQLRDYRLSKKDFTSADKIITVLIPANMKAKYQLKRY
jgi:hypothetical protein